MYSFLAMLAMSVFFQKKFVDKAVEPYYNSYMKQVELRCKPNQYNYHPFKINIVFDDLEYPTLAYCGMSMLGSYEIHFDRKFWDKSTHQDRRTISYHEFSHCTFWEDHSKDPNNFMYKYFITLTDGELDKQFNDYLTYKCMENKK